MPVAVDGTQAAVIMTPSSGSTLTLKSGANALAWTLTFPTGPGTAGQVLATDGSGNLSWSTSGGAITVADDTTTNATRYPIYTDITTGSLSTAYVASTEYTFNPASGTLTAPHVEASSAIFLNADTISASFTIPPGMNGLSSGPVNTIGGAIVTVPSGRVWKVV